MKGEPVPPEGLDHINSLQKWLEQHPNDVMVRSKLAELQRDPRYAEPDEPDDIMPQVPELADFQFPQGSRNTSTPPASSPGPVSPHRLPASAPHSTSWLQKISTFRAGTTLRIHPACTLSSDQRAGGERARPSGKPCRATSKRTNGSTPCTVRPRAAPRTALSSEQRASAPGPCAVRWMTAGAKCRTGHPTVSPKATGRRPAGARPRWLRRRGGFPNSLVCEPSGNTPAGHPGQRPDHQRPPPNTLSGSRPHQPQPRTQGRRRPYLRRLLQPGLLLQGYCTGHRSQVRDIHRPRP